MLDILTKELKVHGIEPQSDGRCTVEGKSNTMHGCLKMLYERIDENKKLIIELWKSLQAETGNRSEGADDSEYVSLFISAVESLYDLSLRFSELKEIGVTDSLKSLLNSDSRSFSNITMSRIVDFRLAIEWLDYLLRRDSYLCAMLKYYRFLNRQGKSVEARGVAGPWSNVDLSMGERVVEWADIEDDINATDLAKKRQNRYKAGYEGYGGGDASLFPSPGHYWREMNNEPYSLSGSVSGDATSKDSPYKQRKLLWI